MKRSLSFVLTLFVTLPSAFATDAALSSAKTAETSFETYAATFSPAGNAALHLLQLTTECASSPVVRTLDPDAIFITVLQETMGVARLDEEQWQTLPDAVVKQQVVEGMLLLSADLSLTDVASTVKCAVTQQQVNTWRAQLGTTSSGFQAIAKRMAALR
jgi:hypothetical protein